LSTAVADREVGMDWAHTAQPAGRTETGDTGETADKEEMEGKADAEHIPSLVGDAPRANKAYLSQTSTRLLSLSGDACGA
jgi:hypothetical protein